MDNKKYAGSYKSCVVEKCGNTTENAPGKTFFEVPKLQKKQWCEIMGACDNKNTLYCCEDHFDLLKDVANYHKYRLIGEKMVLKKDALPSKFDCQKISENLENAEFKVLDECVTKKTEECEETGLESTNEDMDFSNAQMSHSSKEMTTAEAKASNEIATLSEPMELFENFDNQEEEDDKSSDEESFHLPIDDDESEKRDIVINGKGETEDDILDKFDTASATADEEPPQLEEDKLLDESEDNSEKNESNDDISEQTNGLYPENGKNSDSEVEASDAIECSDVLKNEELDATLMAELEPEETEQNETKKTESQINQENDNDIDMLYVSNVKTEVEDEHLEEELLNGVVGVDHEGEETPNGEEMAEAIEEDPLNTEPMTEEQDDHQEIEEEILNVAQEFSEEHGEEATHIDIESSTKDDKAVAAEAEDNETVDDAEAANNDEAASEDKVGESVETVKDTDAQTDITTAEKVEEVEQQLEKCENSNDSGKSNSSEQDDLLNISIIRDVAEDDENARDELTKDKELQDQEEESLDKVSESDYVDGEDKDDSQIEYEDDDSKHNDEDTTVIEKGDDTLTENVVSEDSEMREAYKVDDKSSKDVSEHVENKDDEKQEDSGKETENPELEEDEDSSKEGSIKSGKRSLSEPDDVVAKKFKLAEAATESEITEEPAVEKPKESLVHLTSFASFMKSKKLTDKLTRADLEEFCLQKICETILHKTDVGELHQKVKNYEATIDALKKDVNQLTKQTRDLEIVNKKLMNELKLQNGNKKPLVPLKITRSVGLQVKLNLTAENMRRRPGPLVGPQKPAPAPVNRAPVRPAASPRPAPVAPPKTPILNQALQNRRVAPQTPTPPQKRSANFTTIRPKPDQPRASVIDLTDEDDRAAKAKVVPKTVTLSPMKTVTVSQNKTINVGGNKTITVNQTKTIPLTQQKPGAPNRTMATGVRLTPTQLKNGSIAIPASVVGSSSPQLMYVVQPTSTLAGGTGTQKAVIVNFQPTNGVLTSSLNGSAVSVIPKGGIQLKQVNPRKHPAPLPQPPPLRMDSSLKPIPPKPHLSIRKTENGIILQWKMPYSLDHYETIASYQLYAYQETNAPPSTDMWRRVGDVKALALPMACTLTQFADKNKYYFAVRSVDIHKRIGAFSDPEEISL